MEELKFVLKFMFNWKILVPALLCGIIVGIISIITEKQKRKKEMGCMYCSEEGRCMNYDPEVEDDLCVDNDGYCICDEDQDPACSMYESEDMDWSEEEEES